ncbi:unnamed protein product [Rangifer tarandus platyrhynchus]|uniref:Uncharacterized protein n=1 Tax=Rangifer tarandus platyrhynchus TaxID=3082113 RepID=A0ABN8YWT6_RANTA|nr:unnamed protein product [Rangifer tarandus platyrhynchus]
MSSGSALRPAGAAAAPLDEVQPLEQRVLAGRGGQLGLDARQDYRAPGASTPSPTATASMSPHRDREDSCVQTESAETFQLHNRQGPSVSHP